MTVAWNTQELLQTIELELDTQAVLLDVLRQLDEESHAAEG